MSSKRQECGCDIPLRSYREIDRDSHEASCLRTRSWVVRVPYEASSGAAAHADSIRMCRADAVRLAQEYRQSRAQVVRVFPLYAA